jgi:ParB-like chromosome segregation protein Spo0J
VKKLLQPKRFKTIPLAELAAAPWNYKVEDEEKAKKLRANLARNGQIENLIVRVLPAGGYEVINGNHRLEALRALGLVDAMCYDVGTVSDNAARRVAIETNETRFTVDDLRLAAVLHDAQAESSLAELVETTPYTENQLRQFNAIVDTDLDAMVDAAMAGAAGTNDGDEEEHFDYTCPKCGHEFNEEGGES